MLEQHEDLAGGGTHQFDLKGYRFDSGLHYTVPWSVPIFALTTGKSVKEVCPFSLMGSADGTVDRIYLHPQDGGSKTVEPFNMKLYESHMNELYEQFPEEKRALDKFMEVSNKAMLFVKLFLFARLLPKFMQDIYWKLVPRSITDSAAVTAEEYLPTITSNKRLISLLSSMWIDTGARPDRASFMMTAAVFRGVAMEGGCYPTQGSEAMAIDLCKTIVENGGEVLIRASVSEILVENGRACGVKVRDYNGVEHNIPCRRVVSSTGYYNTVKNLLPSSAVDSFKIPRTLPTNQSAGFVMANIGRSSVLFRCMKIFI